MPNHPGPWAKGDVIQIDPEHDPRFGGCFLLVTEVKVWGVQGAVAVPESPHPSHAYYRLAYGNGALIGHAEFVPNDLEER